MSRSGHNQLAGEVRRRMEGELISDIYRDRVKTERTRRYELKAPTRKTEVEVMHTLLGIELRIGRRRLLCPDLSTARYLAVFARLGLDEVAVPYDITRIARLADDLESSWHRMLTLAEHLEVEPAVRKRALAVLIREQRVEIGRLGAGPAVPQFNQNTRQRKRIY
ncbi:MAG: hypothetical protein IPM66_00390 [Acidobacteriota bacterium]|nr:MAG: hypothetical protein IPM66_00390 [Acidobacteriota bacterium]